MIKSQTLLIIGIPALLLISVSSYLGFQDYKPKVLKRLEEVRGIKSNRKTLIPYPKGSLKIGFNKTSEGEEVTFQTNLTAKQVLDFYKNIFQGKNWKTESETSGEDFMTTEFKNDDTRVTIQITEQPNFGVSIVTVQITSI